MSARMRAFSAASLSKPSGGEYDADDFHALAMALDSCGRHFGDAGCGAEQEHSQRFARGWKDLRHQVAAGDSFRQTAA